MKYLIIIAIIVVVAIIFNKEKVKKLVDQGSNKIKDGIDKISDTAQKVIAEEKQSVKTKLLPVDLDGNPPATFVQPLSDSIRDTNILAIKPMVLDRAPYDTVVTKPQYALDYAYGVNIAEA